MIRTVALMLALLHLVVVAAPLCAQGNNKLHRIGYLGNISPARSPGLAPLRQAFVDGLREHGYVEGRNLIIETRFSEGQTDRYVALAEELIALRVELIVAIGSEAVGAVRSKTGTLPIVMLNVSNAVETGFVQTLARPGGNVTGIVNQLGDAEQKQLELLRDAQPRTERVALLWSPANRGSALGARDVERAAPHLEMSIISLPITVPADLDGALSKITQTRPDAIFVHPLPVMHGLLPQLVAFTTEQRIPTISGQRAYAQAGLLMSYAPNSPALFRRAANYVDRILKGGNPAEMPVEQPTRFELIINLKTARAIGLEIPSDLLARADEVID
jgi:putative ABC transport system substrate-binding protein